MPGFGGIDLMNSKLGIRVGELPPRFLRLPLLLLGIGALAMPGLAASADTAGSGGSDQLEEVTITAERRAEDPQKTGISIVAFSNTDLQEDGIKTIADLAGMVPSLSYVDAGNVKYINIRGIGLDQGAPNQTDGVASYLDGAYIAREFTSDDAYFDLQSLEVLRGPQGTYVGQNSTGGAIFMETRKPTFDGVEGYAQATIGTFNYRDMEGAISLPYSDQLAFRLSLLDETRDSFTTNLGPGGAANVPVENNQPGDLSRKVARLQALYKPTSDIEFRVIYQDSVRHSDGLAYVPITAQTYKDPWVANFDYPGELDINYQRETGILDWQLTSGVKLHVVSAYQAMWQYIQTDNDGTSPYVSPNTPQSAGWINIHDWYNTNEADLISTGSGPFQWTAGISELDYHQPFTDQQMNYNPPGLTPNPAGGLWIAFDCYRYNYAGFADISYDFSPQWQVKVGGRYSHEENGLYGNSYISPAGPTGFQIPAGPVTNDLNAGTGRLLINFQADANNLIYATASRGYKPGSWTPSIGAPAGPTNIYGSEFVWNYELGWKANMLDHRLQSAIDVFHMDYQGFQASIATNPADPATEVTKNVNGTKIQGVEAQIAFVSNGWNLSLSGTYLDATYGNLLVFAPAGFFGASQTAPEQINLNGETIAFAPKLSGNAALSYAIPLGSGSTLTPRVQWTYQGSQWATFFDAPESYLPAYAVGSVRVAYVPKKAWRIEGYVTNVTDRIYLANIGGGTPTSATGMFGPPRQYGVTAGYTF
jgi:iron complex outermembrane recepter protein